MAARRKIIRIDLDRCDGCGECILNCPEGALQVIDGKARLVSDLFCDGLGACVGRCPRGALAVEEREAVPYDERKAMENIVLQGPNTIRAHLEHLREHGAEADLRTAGAVLAERGIALPEGPPAPCGCPGSRARSLPEADDPGPGPDAPAGPSRLRNWPVQLALVPPAAPYLRGADLLLAADCAPFAYAGFHEEFLKGRILLVGCPKLDDAAFYVEKLTSLFRANRPRSVTCVHMEVPCCFGLVQIARRAIEASGMEIPFHEVTLGVRGERLDPVEDRSP